MTDEVADWPEFKDDGGLQHLAEAVADELSVNPHPSFVPPTASTIPLSSYITKTDWH